MKHEYFAVRELSLPGGRELAAGDLVATVETPEGVGAERALNAIAAGHATAGKPHKHATAAADETPAAEKKGKAAADAKS